MAGEVRQARSTPAPLAPIAPILAAAQAEYPGLVVGSISVQHPQTDRATVELRAQGSDSLLLNRGMGQRLVFDGVTGAMTAGQSVRPPSAVSAVMNSMVSGLLM